MSTFSWHRGLSAGLAFLFLSLLPCAAQEEDKLPASFSPGSTPYLPWTHRPSKFSFPEQVAGFHRGRAIQYDPSGEDVSVAYDFFDPRVIATLYVYPLGGLTVDQEFIRRQKEVTDMYPDIKLDKKDTMEVTPRKITVLRAVYSAPKMFKGMDEPMRSVLLVGQIGERFVEYRISYPTAGGEAADEAVRRFCQAFAWPAGETKP